MLANDFDDMTEVSHHEEAAAVGLDDSSVPCDASAASAASDPNMACDSPTQLPMAVALFNSLPVTETGNSCDESDTFSVMTDCFFTFMSTSACAHGIEYDHVQTFFSGI